MYTKLIATLAAGMLSLGPVGVSWNHVGQDGLEPTGLGVFSHSRSYAEPGYVSRYRHHYYMRGYRSGGVVKAPMSGRSLKPISGLGLQLSVKPGDTVVVQGQRAVWKDAQGNSVANINLKPRSGTDMEFGYDSERHLIAPLTTLHPSGDRCASKWVSVGWNIAWDGLVCLPFGVATGGIGGFACGAAGTIIAGATSC